MADDYDAWKPKGVHIKTSSNGLPTGDIHSFNCEIKVDLEPSILNLLMATWRHLDSAKIFQISVYKACGKKSRPFSQKIAIMKFNPIKAIIPTQTG